MDPGLDILTQTTGGKDKRPSFKGIPKDDRKCTFTSG
jgi:hypothetical protein